ncbi:MAG: RdgB/HAM1 family non-canonical purine NTP pyrophosphatase [candidate division WOR-3 bacterium]
MRPRILLATSNKHKVFEIKSIVGICIDVYSFSDFGLNTPDETGKTLEENALIKAKYGYNNTGIPSIGEDTGLFVDALNGSPGIYSSRFAGKGATDRDNREKLLYLLKNEENRKARFITVISYYDGERMEFFKGVLDGEITKSERGKYGFGYDPVFIPKGYDKTLAEMTPEEKNKISHRFKAMLKFLKWYIRVL